MSFLELSKGTEDFSGGKKLVLEGGVEIIPDGHNGFLVFPKDGNFLAKAIQALVEEPRLRREMGESGRTAASACFDMKKIVPQITAIYNDLLERTEQY